MAPTAAEYTRAGNLQYKTETCSPFLCLTKETNHALSALGVAVSCGSFSVWPSRLPWPRSPCIPPLPAIALNQNQDISAAQSQRFSTHVLAGSHPDGAAYVVRTLHDPAAPLQLSTSYSAAAGVVTQITYRSQYGPITLRQSPLVKPTASATIPAASERNKAEDVAGTVLSTEAFGTLRHGGRWIVADAPAGDEYIIHIEFRHSSVDGDVPRSVPLSEIKSAIEEVY